MSRLAFGVRRLAFRHHRHFYSNEDSRRDETSAILAVANPEQASHRDPRPIEPAHDTSTEQSAKRRPSRPYFTSFKRSA
jgi:hypothetical protein